MILTIYKTKWEIHDNYTIQEMPLYVFHIQLSEYKHIFDYYITLGTISRLWKLKIIKAETQIGLKLVAAKHFGWNKN